MTPRGIRNNNPGNIRFVAGITSTYRGVTGEDDAGFCIFDTAEHGIQAIARLLTFYQQRHGLRTVAGMINRWAPPTENITTAYVIAVAKHLGVASDEQIDVENHTTITRLAEAIIQHENGQQPYDVHGALFEPALPTAGPATGSVTAPEAGRAPPSATTTKGKGMPIIPILASLLPTILQLFQPKAQQAVAKVTGQTPDAAGLFVQSLFDKLGQIVGIPVKDDASAIQAVAALTAKPDPAVIEQLEEHAFDYLDKLAPILDKLAEYDKVAWTASEASMAAAGERAAKMAEGPLRTNPAFILSMLIIAMVAGVVFSVLWKDVVAPGAVPFSSDMQAFVIGAIVGAAMTAVLNFSFGTTRQSGAKDVLIAEMAKRQS